MPIEIWYMIWAALGFTLFAYVAWMYGEKWSTHKEWVLRIFPEEGPLYWFWIVVMGPAVWGFIVGYVVVDWSKRIVKRIRKS